VDPDRRDPLESLKRRALRRRWSIVAAVLGFAALVVALLIYTGQRPPRPLPGYTLTIEGTPPPVAEDFMGGTRLLFKPGGQVTITARPAEPFRGKIDVNAAICVPNRAGGRYYPRNPSITRDATITLAGTTDEVFDGVQPGSYQLMITIQRPGRLADEPGGTVEIQQAVAWKSGEIY
jgi:hypothetical protein